MIIPVLFPRYRSPGYEATKFTNWEWHTSRDYFSQVFSALLVLQATIAEASYGRCKSNESRFVFHGVTQVSQFATAKPIRLIYWIGRGFYCDNRWFSSCDQELFIAVFDREQQSALRLVTFFKVELASMCLELLYVLLALS